MGGDSQRVTRRVFLSSTYVDLRAHRERVRDTLLSLSLFPVGMEHFGAHGEGDATEISTDHVGSADLYLGVVAWRYGTILQGSARSVTQQEYEEAGRLGLPRFIFLSDPATETQDGPDAVFPAATRDPEHSAQLAAFRAEIGRTHVVDFFTTPEDLAARVATSLSSYLLRLQREELAPKARAPRDLPPRATGFVGRERELAALTHALRSDGQEGAAVALVGMAGAGKSTLAAETVAALAADAAAFPGGVTWVRGDGRTGLVGLTWIADQLLAAWGAPLSGEDLAHATTPEREVEARERALRHALTRVGSSLAPALVLLDNVEHDLPLARLLDLLAPLGVRTLVTARHEPASPRTRLVRLEALESAPAVELFAERYTARGGAWEVARDGEPARKVVEALGRLPMAVELAAARAARQQTGVAALAAELGEADRLGKLRDPLDPTHSVRYVFSRSLELLTNGQRARFAALGLPEGADWPRGVIERLFAAVPEAAGIPANDDLEALAALSLAQLAGEAAGPRVRLHPLLRDLAREEWARVLVERQRAGITALVDAVAALAADDAGDFAALAREEDLIAGALHGAAGMTLAPERIVATVREMEPYFDRGGHWRLGLKLTGLALAACRAGGDQAGEARALNNLSVLAQRLGRPDEAAESGEGALALRRELGDRAGEAETLSNLGALARQRGRLAEAQARYEEALALRRALGDRRGEGILINNLGALAADAGSLADAADAFERALAIQRELGDQAGEGVTLNNLGGLAETRGRLDAARDYYERALAVERTVGDRPAEGATLNNLGNLARAGGQTAQARSYYEQALAIRRDTGDRGGEATTLSNLGVLAQTAGQPEEAVAHFERALAVERAAGDRMGEGATLSSLGLLARLRRQPEEAARYFDQALAVQREQGNRAGEALVLNNLGELAQSQGRLDAASEYYTRALTIRQEQGDPAGAGLVLNNLGMLAYAQGQPDLAAERFRQALGLLEAAGATDSARVVRENLTALTEQHAADGSVETTPAAPPLTQHATMSAASAPASAETDPAEHAQTAEEDGQRPRRRWPWSR
jgi:tetratricopeptide (TPR) repeat protein